MWDLSGLRVAVVATDGFEETELTEPVMALRQAGAHVDIVSLTTGPIQAFRHHDKTIKVDATVKLEELDAQTYDALMLPGGARTRTACGWKQNSCSAYKRWMRRRSLWQ